MKEKIKPSQKPLHWEEETPEPFKSQPESFEDQNGKIKLEIPGFNNRTLEFSDSFVEYTSKKIYYNDIIGLSYHSIKKSINFIPTEQSYHISILDSNNGSINIDFSSTFYIKNKEKLNLFSKIIYLVEKVIKPYLFLNLLTQFKNKGAIRIGPLNITTDGLYKDRFFRGPEFLPWIHYKFCEIEQGNMVVYKKDYKKEGHYKEFCSISLSIINSVVLPEIAYYFSQGKDFTIQKEQKESTVNFCPSCGKEVKLGTNFCTQCGEKL